jgi:hypothetical protein
MSTLQQIILAAGGTTATILSLVGALALIFKDTLTNWLNRRLGRSLEQQSENFKYELLRQSEKYKHELSRDMAQLKDELDRAQSVDRLKTEVRKAVAERLLTRRLEALDDLAHVIQRNPYQVLLNMRLEADRRLTDAQLRELVKSFGDALFRQNLYVSTEFRALFQEVERTLML